MARTLTQIRQLTVQQMGLPFISGTADASGGSTTTLKDTPDLSKYADDGLLGAHILLTSGSPSFSELVVTASAQSTGVATFRPALSAAPDNLTYEVLPFAATAIHQAITDALTVAFDEGLLVRRFWLKSLVAGSPIYNAGFDLWSTSTTVHGWTGGGAGVTQSRERDNANIGPNETALGLTSASGSEGRLELDNPWQRFLYDLKGETLKLRGFVKSATASHARLGLYNGSTWTYSDFHSGDGDWNILEVELDTNETDTGLYPACVVADNGATSYFSLLWIEGSQTDLMYPWPIHLAPDGPSAISLAGYAYDNNQARGTLLHPDYKQTLSSFRFFADHTVAFPEAVSTQTGTLMLPSGILSGTRLLCECSGPFTLPTGNTETVEVTLPESLLIAKMAAKNLLERQMLSVPDSVRRTYREIIGTLIQDIAKLSSGHGQASDVVSLPTNWR